MNPFLDQQQTLSRRNLLLKMGNGMGAAALSTLLNPGLTSSASASVSADIGSRFLARAPKAKRVIYLFFSGGPSHIDTFDYKPAMRKLHGEELPESIRNGQRLTGMTSKQ
ncbi:MAG: DUF1501 domain-containing protein, partial [Verrucomicrobiia bacterium]